MTPPVAPATASRPAPAALPPLIILGASVRALAQSAQLAGWGVYAADLFGDTDLRKAAVCAQRVGLPGDFNRYPDGLAAAADTFPAGPWCYSGALENYPDLIDCIAADRPLAGNAGAVVKRVRDPRELSSALREAGLLFPTTQFLPDTIPIDGSWVIKPTASAGGRGIQRWTKQTAATHQATDSNSRQSIPVWQEWIEGLSFSAAFLLSTGAAEIFCLSWQLVGLPWCHCQPHAYCGSINLSLADLPIFWRQQLDKVGALLAAHFGLIGLIGVDLVVDADGRLVVIEVNPRPTASMELGERSTGRSLAASHLSASGFCSPAPHAPLMPPTRGLQHWAKSILFSQDTCTITAGLLDRLLDMASQWPDADKAWPLLADLPEPDQLVPVGAPVLTIFACQPMAATALQTLILRSQRIDEVLAATR